MALNDSSVTWLDGLVPVGRVSGTALSRAKGFHYLRASWDPSAALS
jgi:hypothetical protein